MEMMKFYYQKETEMMNWKMYWKKTNLMTMMVPMITY